MFIDPGPDRWRGGVVLHPQESFMSDRIKHTPETSEETA